MADRRIFEYVIEEIIEAVQADYDTVNEPPEKPYYEFGHPMEIAEILNQKDGGDFVNKKYPMICLLKDFIENPGGDSYFYHVDFTLLICTETDPDLSGRQSIDQNYTLILQPIYELLLDKMVDSKDLKEVFINDIRPQKINRQEWGKEASEGAEGLIFNDHLDIIQCNFSKIKVKFNDTCE